MHTHAGLHIKDVVSALAVKMTAKLQRKKEREIVRKRELDGDGKKRRKEKIPQHFGFPTTSV